MNLPTSPSFLFVCMGNICRSPMVETVARVELAKAGFAARVASAGTESYHVGDRADPRAIEVAEASGYPLATHRARQVVGGDFERHDYVFAMDRVNLRALGRIRAEPAAQLFLDGAALDLDEVPDPYYGRREDFERVLELARAGVAALIARLRTGSG
jgi:protein-tyrosine phosphatase